MDQIQRHRLADGVDIECQEVGAGTRPFVLVHGFTGSRDDWREQLEPLARHGRTLAVDQCGHGGSSNPGDPARYTLEQLCLDLYATLSALAAQPCDLLGHSMGGMVALRYALAYPEHTHSLILMDSAAGSLDSSETARKLMAGVAQLARAGGMGGVVEVLRKASESGAGFLASPVAAPGAFDTSFERSLPKLEQMDPEAFATLGQLLFEQASIADRLSEIRCPTTVMVGEHDKALRGAAEELAEGIEDAELVIIPEAAHQPQLENPKAWLEAVEAHLRRVRASLK